MLIAGDAWHGVPHLEARAAEWTAVFHDVALASKHDLALDAAEVRDVPVTTFGFCAFIGEDDLSDETQARSPVGS